jgi:gas vesicle protein
VASGCEQSQGRLRTGIRWQATPFKEIKMRDQDDNPYFVIEREGGGGLGSFVLGALVGAGLALLFAPQSGEKTQKEIKTKALEFKDAAQERVREAQSTLEDRLSLARENVQARVESVREAVESGRQAATQARSDLEVKLERSKAAYRAGIDAAREVAFVEDAAQEEDVEEEAEE